MASLHALHHGFVTFCVRVSYKYCASLSTFGGYNLGLGFLLVMDVGELPEAEIPFPGQ
jgi:hypothetical protein